MFEFEHAIYTSQRPQGKDLSSFPDEPEEVFGYMYDFVYGQNESLFAFAFLHGDTEDDAYINLYIWDASLIDSYKRYVISKFYNMDFEQEEQFNRYCQRNCRYDDQETANVNQKIDCVMKNVGTTHFDDLLLECHYLYHMTHRGTRELLYKSNLHYLALYYEDIAGINLIGTNPADIFDSLPMKALRLLNSAEGLDIISDPESRRMFKELFEGYGNFFLENGMNKYQCRYINEHGWLKEGTSVNGKLTGRQKTIYKMLGYVKNDYHYDSYMRYLDRCEKIKYYPLPAELGGLDKNYDFVEQCMLLFNKGERLFYYTVEYEAEINRVLKKKKELYSERYSYQDSIYKVSIPSTVQELCMVSHEFKNCLWEYISEIAFGDTVILFVKQNFSLLSRDSDMPLFIVEIENGKWVIQALKKRNEELSEKERRWLEKTYMPAKVLQFTQTEYWQDS